MQDCLLIVDDEAELREILAMYIEEEGIQTKSAVNGQEAFNLMLSAEGKSVMAILSDIKMPKMDGLTLLKNLRENQIEIPVILLTAFGDKEKAVEALKYGAFDFQDKPFDRPRLIETVKNAMQLGHDMKNLEAEIEELMIKNKVPESDREKARNSIKAILLLKKQRREFAPIKKSS